MKILPQVEAKQQKDILAPAKHPLPKTIPEKLLIKSAE